MYLMKKKSYYDKINGKYLVYIWSNKYKRFVNTHMYENEYDAKVTIR